MHPVLPDFSMITSHFDNFFLLLRLNTLSPFFSPKLFIPHIFPLRLIAIDSQSFLLQHLNICKGLLVNTCTHMLSIYYKALLITNFTFSDQPRWSNPFSDEGFHVIRRYLTASVGHPSKCTAETAQSWKLSQHRRSRGHTHHE